MKSLSLILLALASFASAESAVMTVSVDARMAAQRRLHSTVTIPAKPGKLALEYPKWIPGEHGPTGPINGVVNLKITAGGKQLAWSRGEVDMYELDLDVPAGVSEITLDFDYVASEGAFTSGNFATERVMALPWNTVLFYTKGQKSDTLPCRADLLVPKGWKAASALTPTQDGDRLRFPEVSLTTLIDSPVVAGAHVKVDTVRPGHQIAVVADSDQFSRLSEEQLKGTGRLVDEAYALFGARHYRHYTWLVTLSDNTGTFGLEHHESSDDRLAEQGAVQSPNWFAMLLGHEYTHSWNGKYRRPTGLATGDYDTPMVGDLLWVYEGLTEHLGWKLPTRAGMVSPEMYRENLALTAAALDLRSRDWRPLGDTARGAQILYGSPNEWRNLRRGTDFYEEGDLIWLEADALIRKTTNGAKSLDDFCRAFYGGESGKPDLKPYTFDALVEALNNVCPLDWKGFFDQRITKVNPTSPKQGILDSGWELVFTAEPNKIERENEVPDRVSLQFSLGISVNKETITDVGVGTPAMKAGIVPGMTIVAVNGRKFSSDRLRQAVTESNTTPVELIVQNFDTFRTVVLDYHGGDRYPHLVRRNGVPDLLSDMVRPHAPVEKTKS